MPLSPPQFFIKKSLSLMFIYNIFFLYLILMFIAANTCWTYRPHPNECSGGDLDGDLFFISWDKDLIPCQTDNPMDYTGRRPRIMDHKVTLEVIFQQTYMLVYFYFLKKSNVGKCESAPYLLVRYLFS